MALTPKQEKFCQNIVSGMSGKDSYLTAYDTKNCSDNAAYTEATKLLKRDDIQNRITILRKPLEIKVANDAISEYDRIKSLLWSRIQHCVEIGDDAAIARYTDQINKMNQTYININRNLDDKAEDIKDLDIVTLKKLSNGV